MQPRGGHLRTSSQPNAGSVLKLVLAGDAGVGKTLISNRLAFPTTDPADVAVSTVGVDFYPLETVTDDGLKVAVQLWDTAGQERYRALSATTFRGAHGVLLIYDISDAPSLSHLEQWRELVDQHSPGCVRAVVGNKSDLEHLRAIPTSRGAAFAETFGAYFAEVSAYSRDNLDIMLRHVVSLAAQSPTGFGRHASLRLGRGDEPERPRLSPGMPAPEPTEEPLKRRRFRCSAI
jgi:small GTP-binding protein